MTTTPPCPEPSYGCRLYTFQHHAESTICFTHHPARLLPVSLAFHLQCRRCRSIPGSGRSPGEGIGYPLQYSLASLVAQLVKNLPAMWETWVHSLGWKDPLEKRRTTHSSLLAWEILWTEEPGRLSVQIRSDQISRSVVSNSLRPHESQHARPPCPSPTPGGTKEKVFLK